MTNEKRNNQPLTINQKIMFGLFCWGKQSHGQADNFKTNGYNQKYVDAKKSMKTGLVVYGLSITIFILTLIMLRA